jgi:hypothetical protein
MRARGLLIAAVVLAVLGGLLFWSNREKAKEDSAPPKDAGTAPKIVSMAQPDIGKVQLNKKDGQDVVLEKRGESWQITAPTAYNADQDAVNSLVSSLSALTADSVVEQKASDLAPFGLDHPAETVVMTGKGGKTQSVLIGDEVPTGGDVYAKLEGDPRIFTVASFARNAFDKTANDLRDKRLLTFDQASLARVELLNKGQDIEFGKNNQGDWQILKPGPYRADGLQVEELIRKLNDGKIDPAVSADDQKKAAAAFASAAPAATVKVTDNSSTQDLQVRKTASGDYYAKSSVVEGVWKSTAELGDGLNKTVDDFRNKKLFDFGFDDPNRIDVHDGATSYDFLHAGDKWLANGKEMDSVSLESFIDKLRELSATTFVDSGFTTPSIEITVVSKDNKRTEKVAFSKQGDGYVARRENENSLYQVDGKAVQELENAAASVKPLATAKK